MSDDPSLAEDQIESSSPDEEVPDGEANTFTPYRPSAAGLGAWCILLAAGVALIGPAGAAPAFIVALVRAGRFPVRLLGGIGVGLLGLSVLVVIVSTRSGDEAVHQEFVTDSMLAHHLTFIGLALILVGAVLDKPVWVARSERLHGTTAPVRAASSPSEPMSGLGASARWALLSVVIAAVGAVVLAVLGR